jgi:hypothetical protein
VVALLVQVTQVAQHLLLHLQCKVSKVVTHQSQVLLQVVVVLALLVQMAQL